MPRSEKPAVRKRRVTRAPAEAPVPAAPPLPPAAAEPEARAATEPAAAPADSSGSGSPRQYLTFVVGGQEYGIEIHRVREIRGYSSVTALPNTPRHIRGLLNVRGTVIPVFDLRAWFGLDAAECTPVTVIITVSVGDRIVGLLVDSVSDVLEVAAASLSAPPDMGSAVDTSLMTGLAAVEDRLLTVLSLDTVVGDMLAA